MKINSISGLLLVFLLASRIGLADTREAEYGKYCESWTLLPDQSQEYRCYQELTLFTHTAMNAAYGETFITYNPDRQTLKIHASYTRQRDGSIVPTPPNAFVEVLPKGAARCPAYNNLREMVIVHTGLELGATIVLDYSLISRPGYLPEIDVCQPLLKSSPVKEYRLSFNLPDGKKPHYTTVGTHASPRQTSTGDRREYQWTFRNLPAFHRVPGVNLQNEDLPGLLFTTYESPQQALQTLCDQFDPSAALSALAGRLTEKKRTATEKLQAIQQYVNDDIDNCPLTLSETGHKIRPAAEVIRSAYGTEAEKINLLQGLLNAAGIRAHVAAAYYLNVPEEYCGLKAVGKWVVIAEADGNTFRLEARSKTPAAPDCNFLLSLSEQGKVFPPRPENRIRCTTDIQWQASRPEASTEAAFSNNLLSYSSDHTAGLLDCVSAPQIRRDGSGIILKGKQPVSADKRQDYLLLSLPETNKGINRSNYARYNGTRPCNLLLPATADEEYTYTLTLPAHLELCTPAYEKELDNAAGSLRLSLRQEGQKVFVHRSLLLKKRMIIPSEYRAFRQLMTEWDDSNGKVLLLKTRP